MAKFILLDLTIQVSEVIKYTEGLTKTDLITWLNQFGSVTKLSNPYDDSLYVFCSNSGIKTGFRLTDKNELFILGYHTILKP